VPDECGAEEGRMIVMVQEEGYCLRNIDPIKPNIDVFLLYSTLTGIHTDTI
jgi:hypothetical protein